MKVILLQDVAKIGKKSQIIEVPDGYALNKLIPRKMAEAATPANLSRITRANAEVEAVLAAAAENFSSLSAKLKKVMAKVPADTNEKRHTFKAVSVEEIVLALKESDLLVSADMINITSPIKSEGEHEIELVSGSDKSIFKIEVVKK